MEPKFRRSHGRAVLYDTEEARKIKREKRPWARALSPEKVKETARLAVLRLGGDPSNEQHLLGQYQMQFGMFRGQTFKWVAENSLGYAGYLAASISEESGISDSVNSLANKGAFKRYITHYPEGRYATSHDDSVGPDNTEGFQAVQNLVDNLYMLKDHSLALSREEAAELVARWECLSECDKRSTTYPPRHQDRVGKWRFRATKAVVVPGVESTKRCFAGGRNPAQWPDCNRVCEALFDRLCMEYPGARRLDGIKYERWSLVSRAYLRIRQVILNNAVVMGKTTIQLPVMNSGTIASWYCKRERAQEKSVPEQGLSAPQPKTVSTESLPAAIQREDKPCMPSSNVGSPHIFVLAPSTSGTAQLKRSPSPPVPLSDPRPPFLASLEPSLHADSKPSTKQSDKPLQLVPRPLQPAPHSLQLALCPLLPAALLLVPLPPAPQLQRPASQTLVPVGDVPYTTQYYRKRKRKEEEQSGKRKRKYVRKSDIITCKQCQCQRDPTTHYQYFGNWYCKATAPMTLVEWRAALEARGYGMKKHASK